MGKEIVFAILVVVITWPKYSFVPQMIVGLDRNESSDQILASLGKPKQQHMGNLQQMPVLC